VVVGMVAVVKVVVNGDGGGASTGGCGSCHSCGHALDTLSSHSLDIFVFI
jgi:hypothetical protein